MVDIEAFTGELAAALTGRPGRAMVGAICQACVQFGVMSGVGVTVMSGPDVQEPWWATDEVAARIDALQFALGEGPCLDAFASGQPVLISDITAPRGAAGRRWPVFATEAGRTAARGMFVFPLQLGVEVLGVMDCYRHAAGSLGPDELTAALHAADAVVLALLESSIEESPMATPAGGPADDPASDGNAAGPEPSHNGSFASGLQHARVHQATGMITEQADVSVEVALARLRAAAFAAGRPLDDVAADVLAHRLYLDEAPAGPDTAGRDGSGDDPGGGPS